MLNTKHNKTRERQEHPDCKLKQIIATESPNNVTHFSLPIIFSERNQPTTAIGGHANSIESGSADCPSHYIALLIEKFIMA